MVCLRNICVNTLHKGDSIFTNNNNMFRALLVHPQEALHKRHLVYWYIVVQPTLEMQKRHLVYCVRVMSVGCTRIGAAN
jgi:hypothetical protein